MYLGWQGEGETLLECGLIKVMRSLFVLIGTCFGGLGQDKSCSATYKE
jgi:hypothetical protein